MVYMKLEKYRSDLIDKFSIDQAKKHKVPVEFVKFILTDTDRNPETVSIESDKLLSEILVAPSEEFSLGFVTVLKDSEITKIEVDIYDDETESHTSKSYSSLSECFTDLDKKYKISNLF